MCYCMYQFPREPEFPVRFPRCTHILLQTSDCHPDRMHRQLFCPGSDCFHESADYVHHTGRCLLKFSLSNPYVVLFEFP